MHVFVRATLQKAAGVFALVLSAAGFCQAADLRVWSAGAVKPALEELAPQFQKATGLQLDVQYAPVGVWIRRLAEGNSPDVLILSVDVVQEVEDRGWVPARSASPLGSVGVGLAVKQGAVMPDISSPEALRRTLLAAKSVTYMDPQKGTSGKHFASVLDQLGIAEQIRPKATLGDVGYVLEPVARGEIELGVQQITEILPVKGAVLVGPLPSSLQKITTYSIMPTVKTDRSEMITKFRQFLQTPEAQAVFKLKGFMAAR
jgi:molybdate transport system substrate-binding protein